MYITKNLFTLHNCRIFQASQGLKDQAVTTDKPHSKKGSQSTNEVVHFQNSAQHLALLGTYQSYFKTTAPSIICYCLQGGEEGVGIEKITGKTENSIKARAAPALLNTENLAHGTISYIF